METHNQPIRLDISDSGLATLTFAQPERGNPIDGDFCRAFKEVIDVLYATQGLRALLIRGEGKNFSFGGDIKSFTTCLDNLPAKIREWTGDLHMGVARMLRLPIPVVAEVQGWAMGGSIAVLAGADFVVAGESTRFGSAFAHIGFSCDTGSTITLSMRMGAARAKRFTMLAQVLSSAEAQSAGLVDEVVPDGELTSRALALAEQLAAGPTTAYGEIKRLFLRAGTLQLESQLEEEAQALARVGGSADAKGAITAFIEKRKYSFTGK